MVRALHYSGIYHEAEHIYCYISGELEIIPTILSFLTAAGSKFIIVKCVPNDTSYERLTLEDIHRHVSPKDQILYIHSKGVSQSYMDNPHKIQCIDDWTHFMLYYLVRHYKYCIEKLESYDTVGLNFTTNPSHWSGNFWWVRGDYFLTLPTTIGPHYYDPELFFLFVNNPRYYEVSNSYYIPNTYECRNPPGKYIDRPFP
jgi:hypothetical protein